MEDSIDWQTLHEYDVWLDNQVSQIYKDQPLAQDWARISKIAEETGEAIQEFIRTTGQNPRKGSPTNDINPVLKEIYDVIITGLLAACHFTQSPSTVRLQLRKRIEYLNERIRQVT